MNEETKLPTTRDSKTNKRKGRCAPAHGSALGDLVIWEEEGGWCSPRVCVKTADGEVSISELVTEVIPGCPMGGGKTGHRVEITVRLIAPNDRTERPGP